MYSKAGWGSPPANASAAPRPSALTPIKTVGAGLLAKAVYQSLKRVADLSPSRASPLPHLGVYFKVGAELCLQLKCRAAPRPPAQTAIKTVGAGLPAKAVCQSLKRVADPSPSRASPLPHLGCISRLEPSCAFSSNAVQHLGLQPEHRSKLWERACSRKRCASRRRGWLIYRLREQARSHIWGCISRLEPSCAFSSNAVQHPES
jgi:hypothetical protein